MSRQGRFFHLFDDFMDQRLGHRVRFSETEWTLFRISLVVLSGDPGRILSRSDTEETDLPCGAVAPALVREIGPELFASADQTYLSNLGPTRGHALAL
jgi:hypothetical protein